MLSGYAQRTQEERREAFPFASLCRFHNTEAWLELGLSNKIANTTEVKRGCRLSPTLSCIYIDEITAQKEGRAVHSFINILSIWLILFTAAQARLKHQMDALQNFCTQVTFAEQR